MLFRLQARPGATRVAPYTAIAERYDAVTGIADFFRTRDAFEKLVHHYGIHFRSAADIGCGTGLFACYLNRRWGVPVLAVDRSPDMLAVAERNCSGRGVKLLLQDFRCLRLPRRVDLATANTYTINHALNCHELKKIFDRVYRNLRSGGHFIFDLITDRQDPDSSQPLMRRVRLPRIEILQRVRWDPDRKLLSIVIVHRPTGPCPPLAEIYMGRGYSLVEIAQLLRGSGFFLRGIHDADTLQLAGRDAARAFIVARSQPPETTQNRIGSR